MVNRGEQLPLYCPVRQFISVCTHIKTRGFGTASLALRKDVHCARFEVSTVLIVRIQVFRVVTSGSMVIDFRCFEVAYAFVFSGHRTFIRTATRLPCVAVFFGP